MQRAFGRILRGVGPLRRFVLRASAARTDEVLRDILGAIRPGDRVLDIGAGTCAIAAGLRARGFDVVPVDVQDFSCVEDLRARLYDGVTLPFPDGAFDVALLVTVLHHVADPDALLAEAGRVARVVVVQEDVYEGRLQRYLTYTMDSLSNLEFVGHPHTNREDVAWRRSFDKLGFRMLSARAKRFWRIFASVTYVLQSPTRRPGDGPRESRSPRA